MATSYGSERKLAATRPRARASSCFVGFLSTAPSDMTTIGSSSGFGAKRASSDEASRSSSGSTTRKGIPLRPRKLDSRVTSGDLSAPMSTGPPKPISISATRRRMSARRMRSPSSASATSSARSASGGTTIASTSPTARASNTLRSALPESCPSSAMTSPGTTSVISSTGAPISCANAATGTACPSPSRGTIATRPERITYIPATASPAWNRSSPAGNRLTSPKRRTRSISAAERTGNIWWNRDVRAPLDVAGSSWLGMSDPRSTRDQRHRDTLRRGAGAVKDAGPCAATALRWSRLCRSGRGRQADEVETLHACVADPDRPVEVRSGHAPGRADEPDDFPRVDDAPGSHPRLAEVAVEAEEPEPMVEDDRTAGEEEVLVQYDPSTLHGVNDGPGRRAQVHAAVRRTRLAVEYPTAP